MIEKMIAKVLNPDREEIVKCNQKANCWRPGQLLFDRMSFLPCPP